MCPSKSGSMSSSTIFAVRLFDGKYSNLQKSPKYFTLALTISEMPPFQCLPLKLGQGHLVQVSRISKSTNVIFYFLRRTGNRQVDRKTDSQRQTETHTDRYTASQRNGQGKIADWLKFKIFITFP